MSTAPAEIVAQLRAGIAARRADDFIPYIYGAASGAPSPGRPELVLAAGLAPETTAQRFERELGVGLTLPAAPGRPRQQGCGTAAGARRHFRAKEKPCEPCRLANNAAQRARLAARRQRGVAPAPAATPEPVPPAPPKRCRSCGYLVTAPGHLTACAGAA